MERLANVDDYSHDLVVGRFLELFADSGEQDLQPDLVIGALLLECVRPSPAVLVLRVFPLWPDACLEEVIV